MAQPPYLVLRPRRTQRGIIYAATAIVLALPAVVLLRAIVLHPRAYLATAALTSPLPALGTPRPAPLAELAERDPLALARMGYERYLRDVQDYQCVLIKQERLDGKLTAVQEVELRYREAPRSVYMLWRRNEDQARRALWVDDPAFVNDKGQRVARVEPAGAIVRLFVKDIFIPVDGPDARKSSRRTINEAGFRSTFELLGKYNALADERGVLDLRYGGVGVVDGRPTYVLVRDLPYQGPNGPYPDARMVLHLDQEWLLPVAVYSYADREARQLLGSYLFTQVELNPGLGDEAFRF